MRLALNYVIVLSQVYLNHVRIEGENSAIVSLEKNIF